MRRLSRLSSPLFLTLPVAVTRNLPSTHMDPLPIASQICPG